MVVTLDKEYYSNKEMREIAQNLIDICFECVLRAPSDNYYNAVSNEAKAEWVAKQLRKCGFDTTPVGTSWGVLK